MTSTGRVLNFYECKEHGWGDLSAITMRRAAELGACEILYVSKGAACAHADDVYRRVMCPSRFVTCNRDTVVASCAPANGLLRACPNLDTHTVSRCVRRRLRHA